MWLPIRCEFRQIVVAVGLVVSVKRIVVVVHVFLAL